MEITQKQKDFILELAEKRNIDLDISLITDSKLADLKIKELINGDAKVPSKENGKAPVSQVALGLAFKLVYQDWSRKYKRPIEFSEEFRKEVDQVYNLMER